MEIIKLVKKQGCLINLKGKNKEEIITSLVKLAESNLKTTPVNPKEAIKRLLEREKQGSTGIGEQVAIPHAEISGLKEFIICIATSKKGLEFDAIDKKKCRLFFLILGPEGKSADHLKILAGISRLLSQPGIKNELLKAPTPLALYESFIRHLDHVSKDNGEKANVKLLNLILFDQELIYSILEIFLEEGIDGANIMESSGMGEYISNVPIFAGFLGFMNQHTYKSKTIQALIPENRIKEILEKIEGVTGNLETTQGAAWFIIPVESRKGSLKMM